VVLPLIRHQCSFPCERRPQRKKAEVSPQFTRNPPKVAKNPSTIKTELTKV